MGQTKKLTKIKLTSTLGAFQSGKKYTHKVRVVYSDMSE